MSAPDTPAGVAEGACTADRESPGHWRSIARLLYTQNPFYLLSVAFVLHSTRLWYREGAGVFNPWPLMAIIGGYILLVTATGFVLVRFGKVWDDARSILLILLLLFVELSLTFDGVLVSQPATGRGLLVTGWLLALAVSEGLLTGLRIRLSILFRGPFHLLLVLLFLYPLAIVTGPGRDVAAAVWQIYLFSPVAAVVLLTLLPAIRRGPQYVAETGTPWRWPWFPWSLIAFLTVCLGLRAYALSLSFDPVLMQNLEQAMRLDSAFGLYFLAPMLLAVGMLLLEAGIVARNRMLQDLALLVPAACVVLSVPSHAGSAPYADFLQRFIDRVGSPLWLAALAGIAFYTFASLRRVKHAEPAFWGMLLVGSCLTRTTVDFSGVVPPQAWALWLTAVVLALLGRLRFVSFSALAAALALIAACRASFLGTADSLYRDVVPAHLAGLAILTVAGLFDDYFARWLRKAGVPLLVAAVFAASLPTALPARIPEWTPPAYLAGMIVLTFAYAYLIRSPAYFFAGLVSLVVCAGRLLYELSGYLKRLFSWQGAGWFVWGLVWFVLAVLISARKAGIVPRLARLVPRGGRRWGNAPGPRGGS
jgi:hypothetical protein